MNQKNVTGALAVVAIVVSTTAFYFSWQTSRYCIHLIPPPLMASPPNAPTIVPGLSIPSVATSTSAASQSSSSTTL